ncbi:MAG: hypothetical protein Kow0088_09540 [Anaerolineales bacterium]
MQSSRLGCLTPLGLFAGVITVLIIAGTTLTKGGMLYSPGALNAQSGQLLGGVTSHAETGGDCQACHVAPWSTGSMADRCLVCHTDVLDQKNDPTSLHGIIAQNEKSLKCARCHPEHRGQTASLTVMTLVDFPHELVGFSLRKHLQKSNREAFVCVDCHVENLNTFNPLTCDTCHQQTQAAFMQAHRDDFGTSCLNCHDGVDRFGQNFDHANFQFRLEGKHQDVNCVRCHTNARSVGDFALASNECVACHLQDDKHDGKFGSDCSACHTAMDWDEVTFDHARTSFPLTGAHQQIECEKCHTQGRYIGTPMACVACHLEPQVHAGLFGTDCEACHTTRAWQPATFNGPHTFPINHGEANSCLTCHPTTYRQYTCYGCHEHDEAKVRSKHLKEGISDFQDCVACHPSGREHEGGDREQDD